MKAKIECLIKSALNHYFLTGDFDYEEESLPKIHIERTRDQKHGDYASNIAMILAKPLKKNPRHLAEELVNYIPKSADLEKIEIAGPGFINFHLTESALQTIVTDILKADGIYGHASIGNNKTVIIEFVSANPTGPLHVGHGRHAAYGATVANLLEAIGYKVHREYYVNDAGRQMQILTVSIWLRYLELFGHSFPFPSNAYKGDYIMDIAKELKVNFLEKFCRPLTDIFSNLPDDQKEDGTGGDKEIYIDALISRAKSLLGEENYELILKDGLKAILNDIREDLAQFGVTFQEWFSEKSLQTNGDITRGLERLQKTDSVYERDGATWFQATSYGDEKDRVVIRENGQSTYFASDVGYHLNKYERKFDLILDLFGADHHGYAPRIKAFLKAAGEDENKVQVLLIQFAILYRGKQKVSMSTRGGTFVTLRELREEVGNDAARFFYVMRKCDQHLDFDLELAKSKSNENPVYYIQYAFARICSVERQLDHLNLQLDMNMGLENRHLLTSDYEKNLLRILSQFPEIIEASAVNYEPHILVHYLQELATYFHTYYNACKFIVEEKELRNARMCLIVAVKVVIGNSLKILGVSAPEIM
ncbi:MAG: arginine--tRNA ligase [Gammaproteobacteria bacterium]|nr:arginine--tRNA ligase [Gammaproteobacteria bacterium]